MNNFLFPFYLFLNFFLLLKSFWLEISFTIHVLSHSNFKKEKKIPVFSLLVLHSEPMQLKISFLIQSYTWFLDKNCVVFLSLFITLLVNCLFICCSFLYFIFYCLLILFIGDCLISIFHEKVHD